MTQMMIFLFAESLTTLFDSCADTQHCAYSTQLQQHATHNKYQYHTIQTHEADTHDPRGQINKTEHPHTSSHAQELPRLIPFMPLGHQVVAPWLANPDALRVRQPMSESALWLLPETELRPDP